ncbi:hypothetical protein VAA_03334 [Vibrio anguillarum 775]|nr:hypothetical protein VAA_03334 [Vibrio anguillarum 775]
MILKADVIIGFFMPVDNRYTCLLKPNLFMPPKPQQN